MRARGVDAARPEVLGDGTRSGKESLGVSGGLEPLHVSLPLTGGLVGVHCAIVEMLMLPMCYAWKNFALSGSIAFQFIGDEYPRYIR
jgi:hypothetical protein